jgi:hypothetical protein
VAHREPPIGLTTTSSPRVGRSFNVKVVSYSDAGVATALAGARVSGAGVNAVTNSRGIVSLVARRTGTLVLRAQRKGYIRAAPVSVRVFG